MNEKIKNNEKLQLSFIDSINDFGMYTSLIGWGVLTTSGIAAELLVLGIFKIL